ncbi:MAG: hypothetical protein ABI625_06405, partial [bacterium]
KDLANPPPAVPLTMRQATFGSAFQAAAQLRGGGAMLLKVSGSALASPQLLDLHALSGLPLSNATNIGIAVLRIQ